MSAPPRRPLLLLAALCLLALQACADGRPVDPCATADCAAGTVCVGGTCRPAQDGQNDGPNNGDNPTNNGGDDNDGEAPTNNGGDNNGDNNGQATNNGASNNANNGATNNANNGTPDASDTDPPDVAEDITPDTPEDVAEDSPPDIVEDTAPDVPSDTGQACAVSASTAENTTLPVDIIWMVDTSGSMDQESDQVESNLDDFARFIARSNLDYHVILIGTNSLCVPSPPSGGGCPDLDSDRYFHVRQTVNSTDALQLALSTYPQYRHFLRRGAQVHFVVVTDDNSAITASEFVLGIRQLANPGFPNLFTFHTIAAFGGQPPPIFPFQGCCGWQGCGAAIGEVYVSLATQTGGVASPICLDESEWAGIFDAIAANVIEGTILPCEYDIPSPGPNMVIDPNRINVYHAVGQDRTLIPNVEGPVFCNGAGWYYDDPFAPTQVILCSDSCGFSQGTIQVEFGCTTIKG